MKLFDSHAHYDDPRFDGVRDDVLREVHASGVARITNIGSSLAASRTTLALADRFPFVRKLPYLHPAVVVPVLIAPDTGVNDAIGNMIDRIFRGGLVVDYLDVQLFEFAVFNFADCFVTVGTIVLMIYIIFFMDKDKKPGKAQENAHDKA